MSPESASEQHITLIEPRRGTLAIDLKELWAYRELLFMLAWRDATVRYKQSVVGVGWALLQPLMMMAIFTVIFGRFAKLPSDGVPYPVFALCALLPWNYFARSLQESSNSLVGATHLVTKIYFPRIVLPLSKVFSGLIDFGITLVLLLGVMAWYGIAPSPRILLLPIFLMIVILTAFALGLWLTALNVKYRDVVFVMPFFVQIWMYASPVIYSTSSIPERWQSLHALNPMVGVIDGFRWALLGKAAPNAGAMAISLMMTILILVGGLHYFRRMERTFADLL